MVKDMNYEDMSQMDFCQVIVETIKAGAIDWQKMKKGGRGNKDHLYGLAQGPVIMYLDSLLLPNTREMNMIAKKMNNSSTPRANYLDEKDLKKIAKEDMKKDGKGRPNDYEFGKIETWKGTDDRIFFMAHVNAASPSTSLQVVPGESRRRGKQATKLLMDAPKLMCERVSSIRTISEPEIITSRKSEEAFKRISKMLEQVLVEATQLPALRQINLAGCTDDEANYDELARQRLADHTQSLIATFEQHNAYQRMCCNRRLTPIAETVEDAPIRTRKARNVVEEKLEGTNRTRAQKKRTESQAKTQKKHSEGSNTGHEHAYKTSTAICADMLKHKVVIEDEEMKHVQCGMTQVETPQFPEEIDTCARDTQATEVLDSEDECKEDSQHLKWEHERKDPPIKSDHPPDPSKETRKMSELEQRIIEQRKRDAGISVPREASKGENRKLEKNLAVSSTSCIGKPLQFLLPKMLAPEEEKALFLGSLSPDEVHSYNELVVRGGMNFQDFKTAFTMEKEDNFNKEVDVCPSKLQLDSPYMSTRQSSEITLANIISIKRSLKRSTRLYGVTSIPTFEHQHFIHMDKAKGLHDYLMSDEGQKECRNANLYKSAVHEDCITGEIMLDQLQKGGKGQMEATMCNALFEEWTEQKQYNTSDKAILTAEFANLPRFKVVHQLVHGREMESKGKGKGNWQVDILEDMPMVNKGESAYVALKLAFLYNDIKFVEDTDDFDDDLEIWKAETLYMLLLSEVNEVKPGAMGQEILKVLHMDEE
ncbi:hypothetical protein ZWY2020_049565 [Hordeum vulgare]|nr:hypothetical protein ZWY2020_049565 [Hordeum vulgare]